MKIIYNFTGSQVTQEQFKKGVIDIPQFLKVELGKIDDSVSEGKNSTENGCRLALGLLKDSAPSGAEVGVMLPETITYKEWKGITTTAAKVGVGVYIDSEMF